MAEAEEQQHRWFGASSSSRWWTGGCTGSLVLDYGEGRERSRSYADRGHQLHAEAHRMLVSGDARPSPGLTPPDAAAVQEYVDLVRSREGRKFYEFKADLIDGLLGGTTDCAIVSPSGEELEIIDAKFGSQFVDPVENTQMLIYAMAAIRKLALLGYAFKRARLTICQPACDNTNSWLVSAATLKRKAAEVVDLVGRVMDGEAVFEASDSNCHWCKGAHACPALNEAKHQTAVRDFTENPPAKPSKKLAAAAEAASKPWDELTLGDKLRLVPVVEHWIKSVEAEARAAGLEGNPPDGFKVVEGRKGNRDWSDQRGAVDFLARAGLAEADLFTEPKMISPAQAEEKLKEKHGKPEAAALRKELEAFWKEGDPGAPTLAPEEDARPAIKVGDMARRDFAAVAEEEPGE